MPPLLLIEREDLPHATLAAHGYARVSLLLPTPDEFPMNFEGLGVFFRHICNFPRHFAYRYPRRVGAPTQTSGLQGGAENGASIVVCPSLRVLR